MVFFLLLVGFMSLNTAFAAEDDDDISCIQPTIDGCRWEPALAPLDTDTHPSIVGNGYIRVPVQPKGLSSCTPTGDNDGMCDGGIRSGEICNTLNTEDDDSTDCPEVGCITDNCTTNKLAWEVEVSDTHSAFYDPNPCAETGGKLDLQCSDNVETIPEGCTFESPMFAIPAQPSIVCPVDFYANVENCELFVDDDDAVAPVRSIDPGIGVLLSGKHLYNPAKGKPSGGPGKNPKRNGINETGLANCVPDFFGMPAN